MTFEDTFIMKTAVEVLEDLNSNADEDTIDHEINTFEFYADKLGQKRYDDLIFVISDSYDPIWYFSAVEKRVLEDREISIFELAELKIKLIREKIEGSGTITLIFKTEEEALKYLKWGWNKEYADYQTESFDQGKDGLKAVAEKLWNYFTDAGYYPENVYTEDGKIQILVDGDWKHDHRYVDRMVERFADKEELNLQLAEEQPLSTAESDGDWYESLHVYTLED